MHTLQHLAAIRFVGEDSRAFLQGQLSQDLTDLTPQHMQLASCNSAQGRVQAVLRLLERDDGIWLLLPTEIVDNVITRLRKYILRARTRIEDARAEWKISTATFTELQTLNLAVPNKPGDHVQQQQDSVIRWNDVSVARYLILRPSTAVNEQTTDELTSRTPEFGTQNSADVDWLLADIRAGLPQIWTSTQESFVAQMLNLDLLNGISFSKGCYTGQEIVARAHYRGTVKRRMFRFSSQCAPPLPGTRILSGETHAGEVVTSAVTPNGCELLAVINLLQRDAALHAESATDCPLTGLPLPYPIE